jgi:hypothetical protein
VGRNGPEKRRLKGSRWFIMKTGNGIVRMYRLWRDRLSFLEEKWDGLTAIFRARGLENGGNSPFYFYSVEGPDREVSFCRKSQMSLDRNLFVSFREWMWGFHELFGGYPAFLVSKLYRLRPIVYIVFNYLCYNRRDNRQCGGCLQ